MFRLTINTETIFKTEKPGAAARIEVARILRDVAKMIDSGAMSATILDFENNECGKWRLE